MRRKILSALIITILTATTASAACEGGLGRGWSKGQGNGQFQMSSGDKSCNLGFASFIDNANNKTPATEVSLSKAPQNGTIAVGKNGVIYTPTAGFKGQDKFCTKNKAAGVKGTLSGCVTITVK